MKNIASSRSPLNEIIERSFIAVFCLRTYSRINERRANVVKKIILHDILLSRLYTFKYNYIDIDVSFPELFSKIYFLDCETLYRKESTKDIKLYVKFEMFKVGRFLDYIKIRHRIEKYKNNENFYMLLI